jgi:hypothetical protein
VARQVCATRARYPDTGRMEIDSERARAVLGALWGELPQGHAVHVVRTGSGVLWAGNPVDDAGRPYPGGVTLIGPDERVWSLSSNPAIHDYELGVRLLEVAYRSGFANYLDPVAFGQRLLLITKRHLDDERDFVRDLKAGQMQSRGDPETT